MIQPEHAPAPRKNVNCLAGVVGSITLLMMCTYATFLFRPQRFTTRELYEKAGIYERDNTRKELLDDFATAAQSGSRFSRNYAIGTLGWIGKRESLSQEHLDVVYAGLFDREITTVCASAEALATMQRSELPVEVQNRLAEIIGQYPGSSQARDSILSLSAIPPESVQCADDLLPVLAELSDRNYLTSEPALKLYDALTEDKR